MHSSLKATHALTALLVACLWTTAASAQGTSETPTSGGDKPVCDRYGLVTVFLRCIPHDLSGLAQTDVMLSLGVGGALAGASHAFDADVARKFADRQEDTPIAVGRIIGEAGVQFGVPAAAYFITRAMGSAGATRLASSSSRPCASTSASLLEIRVNSSASAKCARSPRG